MASSQEDYLARLGVSFTRNSQPLTPQAQSLQTENRQPPQPSVLSVNPTPQPGPQPHRPEDIISPNISNLNSPTNGASSPSYRAPGIPNWFSKGISKPSPSASTAQLPSADPVNSFAILSSSATSVSKGHQDSLYDILQNHVKAGSVSPQSQILSPASIVGQSSALRENQEQQPAQHRPFSFHKQKLGESTPLPFNPSRQSIFTADQHRPFDQLSVASAPKPASQPQSTHILGSGINTPPRQTAAQETETVAEAVGEVGEQAEKQVQDVLNQLNIGTSFKPASMKVPESWEDAAAVDSNESLSHQVTIIKPFILYASITLRHLIEPPPRIPQAAMLGCIGFKKEFDQVDRNLAVATSSYIAYALKNNGFKVFRPEEGDVKKLFESSKERVFNIALSTSKTSEAQPAKPSAILATGVNGTIFWAPFTKFKAVPAELAFSHPEAPGFLMPPLDLAEDPNSNSQLKTRVKASSRHPDFFAYGRGKWIYFIRPFVAVQPAYTNPKTEVLDFEKYSKKEHFKISVGKAAKDFAFSPDDTVLASIDKLGKLKFWDISFLVDPKENDSFKVKSSIFTIHTSSSENEKAKAWPTTVMFFDREEVMEEGLAARYVIVGTKQNHNIQIWDLYLGQKVTELNLPHDNESDGVCSLVYNAKLSLLIIGHPTRNSIYIVGLSPPKYPAKKSPNGLTQAEFLTLLVARDPKIRPPKSTVCIMSFREYSLNNLDIEGDKIGTLRSLDVSVDAPEDGAPNHAEDYVMTLIIYHSRGIFQFTINLEQLGLTADHQEIVKPKIVEQGPQGQIVVEQIVQPRQAPATEESASASAPVATTQVEESSKSASDNNIGTNAGAEKKKERKKKISDAGSKASSFVPEELSPSSTRNTLSKPFRVESSPLKRSTSPVLFEESPVSTPSTPAGIEARITEKLNSMQKRISDDLSRQISQSLPQTIEKNFNPMVTKAVSEKLENLKESIANGFDRSATSAFGNAIKNSLPREMEKVASIVSTKLSQDSNFIRALSSNITKDVNASVAKDVQKLSQSIGSIVENTAGAATASAIAKVEKRLVEQLAVHEARRMQDSEQISALEARSKYDSETINRLTEHISNMTVAMRELVEEQAKFKSEVLTQLQSTAVSAYPTQPIPVAAAHASPEYSSVSNGNDEVAALRLLMQQGKAEEAIVQVRCSHVSITLSNTL
jgi:hypothetical protein